MVAFATSVGFVGTRMKVGDTIGQELAPAWSIRLAAKPGAVQSALDAAAVKVSIVGFTKVPALFRSCAVTRWFCVA